MNNNQRSFVTRGLVYLFAGCLVAQPAFAGNVTISNTPLATAGGGASVLPNLLFTLDTSGSMDWDYLPDYFSNEQNGTNQCMTRSNSQTGSSHNTPITFTDCEQGDPAWYTGGSHGTNGVAYDPTVFYKPALKVDGTTVAASPLVETSVPIDAFQAQSTSNINITTSIQDVKYCNSNGVCKRNGTTGDNTTLTAANGTDGQGNTIATAGTFPYRTHLINSGTAIFGLPEMMAMGQFTRSGTTVTVTTLASHGMSNSDRVWVDSSNNNLDVACVTVSNVNAAKTSFQYTTGGSGTINSTLGSFRKCDTASWSRPTSGSTSAQRVITVTTSAAHGLVTNDVVQVSSTTESGINGTFNITVPTSSTTTFTYSVSSTPSTSTGTTANTTYVRTGLYNARDEVNGAAIAYTIVPVEYCSDANLTDCVATQDSAHGVAAYVRFCQTQEQALAPDVISDTSGTPRCRGKYVGYGASPSYTFGRYGMFKKEYIVSGAAPFKNRPNRGDCTTSGTSPDCTYTEEIQNYARWYTYYRTRMQMMKTTAGRAFFPLVSTGSANDKLRVGFITINPFFKNVSGLNDPDDNQGSVQSDRYLKIDTFRGGAGNQAANWYSTFYAQKPALGTPLREALSRAGWIFAGKLNSGLTTGIPAADDPVIASCQRHFTLLTTDGYWNGNTGQDLTGDPIGTTDSVDPTTDAPYTTVAVDRTSTGTFDGATGTSTTTETPSTVEKEVICQGNLQTVFGGGGDTACGCAITQHRIVHRKSVTTQTVVVTGGIPGTPSSATDNTFTSGACSQGTYSTSIQHQTIKQVLLCDGRNNPTVTFANNQSKTCNTGSGSPCSSNSGGNRYVLVRQTATQDQTTTTVDTFQTNQSTAFTSPASSTYEYSVNGSNWFANISGGSSGTNSGCTSSKPSIPSVPAPNPSNNGSPAAGASGTGTTLTLMSPNPSNTVVGSPVTTTNTSGGFSDTLADVAMYYYRSDLRGGKDTKGNATGPSLNAAGTDVSPNNVPVADGSKNYAAHQAMVTFTVGLADGFMRYQSDYDSASTGDFANIKNGVNNGCFWIGGICNWPEPIHDTPAALDDLWHAAVNGRGQFYLGTNVDALSTGIQNTLTALGSQFAAASASATSSPNVTQTDNQIFSTTYETNTWAGRVFAQTIDPATGNVDPTIQWQGDQLLLARVTATTDTRRLLTLDPSGTNKVKNFTFSALNTTEQGFFKGKCGHAVAANPPLLSQCSSLSDAQKDTIDAGSTLVDFLRGQTGNEATLYRDRTVIDPATGAVTQTIMGDTISAKPNYIRAPTFDYGGDYTTFITNQSSRAARVYVGANDGYLHAFDGTSGAEAWAYVPRFLMKNLPILADKTYAATHTYFVEGSPEVNDVFDSTAGVWKTILVGGAAGGGRGYYALDITDPNNPIALWEWCSDDQCDATTSDPDIGLTYGNPVFGKRAYDGRWVVVFSSGLNNNSGAGTGGGFFYVVDAITGALLNKVGTNISGTNVGTAATPSGLMKMSPFYTNGGKVDATFQYIYAGDQLGNMWRLDMNASPLPAAVLNPAPAPIVTRITVLKDASGRLQPITTRPIPTVVVVGTLNQYVLYVGTGRYLGSPDLTDGGAGAPAWQQSYYAFKDKDYSSASAATNLRADTTLVQRSFTQISPTERGISTTPTVTMDWSTSDGWFIDFNPSFGTPAVQDSPGEGVNLVDPRLVNGTIFVTTNVPANTAGGAVCAVGGSSFQYQFDFRSGLPISTSPNGAVGWANQKTITVGVAVVQLPNGAIKAITTGADTTKTTSNVNTNASGTLVKRFSYRVR